MSSIGKSGQIYSPQTLSQFRRHSFDSRDIYCIGRLNKEGKGQMGELVYGRIPLCSPESLLFSKRWARDTKCVVFDFSTPCSDPASEV
jgi:hypothetical protein